MVCLIAFGLLAGEAGAESLEERVRAAFVEHAPELQATIAGRDELKLYAGDLGWAIYLDNLRVSCQTRPDDCDSEIDNFVRRLAATAREEDAAGVPKDKVFPVLRSEDYLRSMEALAENASDKKLAGRIIVPGIALLYVVDQPNSFRFVSLKDLDDAGMSPDQLHQAAAANASRLEAPPMGRHKETPGLFAASADDGLGSSRLFDNSFWSELERQAGGPVAVAAPTRDWILAARLDDPPALAPRYGGTDRRE